MATPRAVSFMPFGRGAASSSLAVDSSEYRGATATHARVRSASRGPSGLPTSPRPTSTSTRGCLRPLRQSTSGVQRGRSVVDGGKRSSCSSVEQPSEDPDTDGDERPPQGRGGGQREADAGEEKDVAGNARRALGHERQRDNRNGPLDQRRRAAPPRTRRCDGSGDRQRSRAAPDGRRCGGATVRTAAGHGRLRSRSAARGVSLTHARKRLSRHGFCGLCA
jgi:hypothetical protein